MVRLEVVQILTQDRCTVCVERTIGTEVALDAPDGTPRRHGSCRNLVLVRLETVLVSLQDMCMVCAKRPIGSEIVLDSPNGANLDAT